MSETPFLDSAYSIETVGETKAFYDAWADSYNREITANGYATPRRCARALAKFAPDRSAPLLDIGCGTGLAGMAFAAAKFTNISGSDLSAEMLAKAGENNGLYADLWQADLNDPFPFETGTYAYIAAVGVLASGHAPADTILQICAKLTSGGLFVFSLNDHSLQDPTYEARLADCVDSGDCELVFKNYGKHLPGIELMSTVYVLRKR